MKKNKTVIDDTIKVSTSEEHNVDEIIKKEIEGKVKEVIDSMSKKYFRNIDVEFSVSVK